MNSVYEENTERINKNSYYATVNENGCLVVPPEIVKKLGLDAGAKLRIFSGRDRVEIFPYLHSLSKVYIEPTSRCNLACETCIRNTWNEPMGDMDIKVFDRLVDQLKSFEHVETVMFGGFGEPTAHKDILYMIKSIKALGLRVEMVTNGTLLDEAMLNSLMDCKLDTLWVSFDGTDETSFEDIREGASFNKVLNNLRMLKRLNRESKHKIEVCIAFVAMKKNLEDLKNINRLVKSTGAKKVSVSNVLPYTKEMQQQMLCYLALSLDTFAAAPDKTEISLPRMDINDVTKDSLISLLKSNSNLSIMANRISVDTCSCRFIRERCTFIRWDGKVSPCMGLLHSYTTYLQGYERNIESYTVGDICSNSLKDIWDSEEYRQFRERVDSFDFSPCFSCGGCINSESNKEDCFGNTFPTCGGCLWAQGIIQCP